MPGGRPKNRTESELFKVPLTPALRQYLEDIVDTELVGSTAQQVALSFIRDGVRRAIAEHAIDRRKPKARAGRTKPAGP